MIDFLTETSNAYVQEFELRHMCLGHIRERSPKVPRERNLLDGYVAKKLNTCKCYDLDK